MSLMRKIQESIAPNILRLSLLPTEQCCFRCEYCYEDFKIGKMNIDIQNGIINLIKKRIASLDELSISWFGGEPLMAKDVVYDLSEKIKYLVVKEGVSYNVNMTTNAYLLDINCYEKLVDLGVSAFQITLDGSQPVHDKIRKRIDGQGTFDVIMKNLLEIKKSSSYARILLRIHYKPDTWGDIITLIDFLKKELLDDEKFEVIFRAVGKWGGKNDDSLITFNNDENYKRSIEKKLIEQIGGNVAVFNPSLEGYICYASKANNFVIRADGSLAKCTVAFSDKQNNVGKIMPDGTLEINQEHYKKWLIGLETGNPDQLACPAKTVLANI